MLLPLIGGCACGAIRYESTGEPLFFHQLSLPGLST